MIFILILLSTFLGAVKHFKLENILSTVLGQSPESYFWIASCLVVFRIGMAFCKYYPILLDFYESVTNLSTKADEFLNRPDKISGNRSNPVNKTGKAGTQKRGYSTSAFSRIQSGVAPKAGLHTSAPVSIQKPRVLTPARRERILVKNRISSGVSITQTKINATFGVKAKGLLAGVFLRTLLPIGLSKTASRAKTILIFLQFAKHIHKSQGMKGLVNYLKASQVLFQQHLGGFRLYDCTDLKTRPARNKAGMPKIVRPQDRALIRAGDWRVAKFYMTLFSLYRVLEFPGKLKLETITMAFQGHKEPGGMYYRVVAYAPAFAKMLLELARIHKIKPLDERGISPRPIVKSAPGTGPNSVSTTPWVLVSQAFNLKRLGLGDCIEYFIKYFEKGTKVPYPGLLSVFQGAATIPLGLIPSLLHSVGKLGFKEEPAGKVRVFAMADAWTQWVLEPFHQYLFDLLRQIDMDGTFDQLRPVIKKLATVKAAYSLDLTAATDRLPIAIQTVLFKHLVSEEFSVQWMRILVGRGYMAFSSKYNVFKLLEYAVGQPMGALSSWASLAITHHFIVQCAAWEAGICPVGTWFTSYAVLGDDLVIFDQRVKVKYLAIVDALGVQCGIAKSLLSPTGTAIEFAKRTFWMGKDISPIPLLEFIAANLTLADAISFARKYSLSFPQLLRVLGYGYRVVGSVHKHVGQLNSRVRSLLFAFYLPETEEDVGTLFSKGNPLLKPDQLKLVVQEFKKFLMADYSKTIKQRLDKLPNPADLIRSESEKAVDNLLERLYFKGLLLTFLDKVIPGWFGGENRISTDVKPDEPGVFGPRRPIFSIAAAHEEQVSGLVHVPASTFNKIEHLIRTWKLSYERVIKLVIVAPMADFRTDALKLINYQIHSIRWGRTLHTTYLSLIQTVRLLSRAGTGKVTLHKERMLEHEFKWGSDPVQMRFWIDFTKCIQRVVRRTTPENKNDSPKGK
uniref:RNA-dependent RNA polymerase n=1 Tax=Rhizoctonia solani mitovirus 15 TaxID=1708336 RepID=A0A0M3SUP8_9VIRU|nr:RNA-dependent RNA polymerase [Rhizoctonia solani mitovirus 15]